MASAARSARPWSLNALSGIGGVQTHRCPGGFGAVHLCVLMPCRALEAFRLLCQEAVRQGVLCVLMPCRALEAFRRGEGRVWPQGTEDVLMPCRALEAFRLSTDASLRRMTVARS